MQTFRLTAKPTKQRRMIYQAPDHVRRKLFAAPLSAELRASQGTKTIPVRSGDTVRIMRGDHKGFEGKISRIDRTNYRIYVEGLTREKVDGTTIFVPIHPSKVTITGLVLDDKWRKKILERKKQARREETKPKARQPEEIPEPKELAEKEASKVEAQSKKPAPKKPRGRKKMAIGKPAGQKSKKEKGKPEAEQESKAKERRATQKERKKTGVE